MERRRGGERKMLRPNRGGEIGMGGRGRTDRKE